MRRPRNVSPEVWSALTSSGLPFTIEKGAKHDRLLVHGRQIKVLNRATVREDARTKRLDRQTICQIRRLKDGTASQV